MLLLGSVYLMFLGKAPLPAEDTETGQEAQVHDEGAFAMLVRRRRGIKPIRRKKP